jgi:hypothetical protein
MVVESPERSVRKGKAATNRKFDPSARPIWEIFAEISGQISSEDWQQVPADASINYRHYLRGTPRVED